jgi:hypothetical protein
MPHTLSVSPDGAYIVLKVVGNITRQSALAQNLEAHALGRELGIDKYLVDATEARNVDSPVDDYEFAQDDMKGPGLSRTARVAILVDPGDRSHDFVETVTRNAGLDVTIFRDRAAAESHLRGG